MPAKPKTAKPPKKPRQGHGSAPLPLPPAPACNALGPDGLTGRERRFVQEYLKDLNASAAYQRAGYSTEGGFWQQNARNLRDNPRVAEAIRSQSEARAKRLSLSTDNLLKEYAAIAFGSPAHLYYPDGTAKLPQELTDTEAAMVKKIEWAVGVRDGQLVPVPKYETWDKQTAMAQLARHLKVCTPEMDVNHAGQVDHRHAHVALVDWLVKTLPADALTALYAKMKNGEPVQLPYGLRELPPDGRPEPHEDGE